MVSGMFQLFTATIFSEKQTYNCSYQNKTIRKQLTSLESLSLHILNRLGLYYQYLVQK